MFAVGLGHAGCLFDSVFDGFETLEDAISGIDDLAPYVTDDWCNECASEFVARLKEDGIYWTRTCENENAYGDECANGRGFGYAEIFEVEE